MNIKIYNRVMEMIKNAPSLMTNPQTLKVAIKSEFDVEVEMTAPSVEHLVDAIDEQVLANYFGRVWQPKTKKYKYSGLDIIDEVNALEPTSVLDLGCGYNEFKGKINNVTGVDPFNDRADHKCSILEYQPDEKYDITIVMGSINFGSSDKILGELENVVDMVKSGGFLYFRVNPGIQHDKPAAKWINFYDWDPVFISNAAQHLNCDVLILRQDDNDRLYFVLRKK